MGLPHREDLGIASAVHPTSPNMTMGLMVGRDEHSLASRAFNECEPQHLVSILTRERGNKKETPHDRARGTV
jgi:hypothetical protein